MGKFQSAFMASGFGVVIDWCLSAFIIEHLGWTYAFYVCAAILGSFAIAWFLYVYDSPNNHPKISEAEKEYILSNLDKTTTKSRVS